jgi:DNA-binding transcriptional ArsR family regulator
LHYITLGLFIGVDTFEAIAEPTRRAVLDLLLEKERSAGDLVAAFPRLTQPAVSRHLRVLREAGLVSVRAEAQQRIYALEPARLGIVYEWLNRYRAYWAAHLTNLEQHLDKRSARKRKQIG